MLTMSKYVSLSSAGTAMHHLPSCVSGRFSSSDRVETLL